MRTETKPETSSKVPGSTKKQRKMSVDLGEVSLDKLRIWSPEALKYFLSVRKLRTDVSTS